MPTDPMLHREISYSVDESCADSADAAGSREARMAHADRNTAGLLCAIMIKSWKRIWRENG